jgi:hypothetical protein
LLGLLLVILAAVNLVGALGPELGFDALWYHLTIPKLFVIAHKVYFIRDNLFYYSLMPKLAEMLYTASLIAGNEIVAKLIHFAFGIMSCFVLYKIARLYLGKTYSLLVVIVFYSNLVIDWLSITAYVDLARVFYETTALYCFLYSVKFKKNKYLVFSAISLGFAISSKLVSLISLPLFVVLIFLLPRPSFVSKIKKSLLYLAISVLIVLPWFAIACYHTSNPVYPVFSQLGKTSISFNFLNPIIFIKNLISTFLFSADPISPFYLLVFPLFILQVKKIFNKYRLLFVYGIFSYLSWYIVVYSGVLPVESSGARFLTSYLPAYSLLGVILIKEYGKILFTRIMMYAILAICISSIFYRGVANFRYLPVIFGQQSKQDFLLENLNFGFGDFYDEDGQIRKIVKQNKVLLLNVHNLYYADFPFSLSSSNTQKFNFILVQNGVLSNDFKKANLIYTNEKTHVRLYRL